MIDNDQRTPVHELISFNTRALGAVEVPESDADKVATLITEADVAPLKDGAVILSRRLKLFVRAQQQLLRYRLTAGYQPNRHFGAKWPY